MPPDFACSIVECQTGIGAKRTDSIFIEPLFGEDAEMVSISIMYQTHYAPEVIDPVGVVKRHVPTAGRRRETSQKQNLGSRWEKRREWMVLANHIACESKIINSPDY